MSVRITDLPEASELNGSELMPIVQNGVTRRTTLDFVNQAAPAALILQQTQQVLADTVQVYDNTQQVYVQTTVVQGEVENSLNEWETQYLGPHPAPPTLDNDGNVLRDGALYWDTTLNAMFVWNGASWTAFSSVVASVNGQIGEVVLDYADVGAANSGANNNITSMSGVTGDIGSTTGLQFNTLTPSTVGAGKLTWNPAESTLDLGLNAAGVVQQIGQEVLYTVRNTTGAVIPNGSSVRVIGTEPVSGRLLVAPAAADGSVKSQTFLGLTTESINPGEDGFVTHFGKVRGVNTTGALYGETWVAGDVLYAHPATPGGLTKTAPQAPRNVVLIALVIEASLSGTLLVRPTYGDNFQNSESVSLSGLAEGDVLWYSATQGRFENRTLTAAGIEAFGTAADSMAAHLAALDPHPQYTTPAEAAAAAPVQSVAGKTGAVSLAKADVGLANVDNTSDADKPISTATQNALNLKLNSNDPSVTNAREWTAETVSQAEAEAGSATTRRAWTAERVFQAIAAWWNASAFKTKLDGIQEGAQVNTVNSVAGKVGIVTLVKGDVGLANVDNTSDLNKPISTATQNALNLKVSKDSDVGAASLPAGTTAQRPAGAMGKLRFNSTLNQFEGHNGSDWGPVGGGALGHRNKIINGKMEIAQRGTSFAAIASGAYSLDRWGFGNTSTAVATISHQSDVPSNNEFQNSLRVAITTADTSITASDLMHVWQRVEGYNARDLIGRTFTLSFWVRSSKTGTHCVALRNSVADRSYIAEYTISAANTWEYKAITVIGGLITAGAWNWTTGNGLDVGWVLAAGSNFQTTTGAWQTGNFLATANQVNCLDAIGNIFAITGVQLEVGSVATPFEHRPYGAELALCQRYYQRVCSFYAGTPSTTDIYISASYSMYCPMRAAPTGTIGANTSFHRPGVAFYAVNSIVQLQDENGFGYSNFGIQAGAGEGTQGQFNGTLNLSAEL